MRILRTNCFSARYFPLLLLAAGCSTITGYPKSSQDNGVELAADHPYFSVDVRETENATSDAARGNRTKQQYRDAVVYARLNAIDLRYYQFEAALNSTQSGFNATADLAVLALNGLGATTGTAATKAALSAASGGVVGAKSAINTDLFYKATIPALITQMRANRQKALLPIVAGLAKTVDAYSLDAALNDVQGYYAAGTLPSAVQQVTANAGTDLAKANAELSVTRDSAFLAGQPATVALAARVFALTDDQALTVEKAMKPNLSERSSFVQTALKAQYPGLDNIIDGPTAKKLISSWIALDDRSSQFQSEWAAALDSATK
jgi:hypothetical protein